MVMPTPTGRFAPSPTGRLHLGSLITAVASFCHIKSLGGRWLIRIEDTDIERCKPAYSEQILQDLHNLGLVSDEPIVFSSTRTALYENYLTKLTNLSYVCACTRKDLADHDRYPRHCLIANRLASPSPHNKIRLILPDLELGFFDQLQGMQWQNPARTLGDVVVKRANGTINYVFACAIDDGLQGITHVMRGLDILPMTMTQTFIQRALHLPMPAHFYHLPLLMNEHGQKLSKQTLATPIDTTYPSKLLCLALSLLGQCPPAALQSAHPQEILAHATQHWNNAPLKKQSLGVAPTI